MAGPDVAPQAEPQAAQPAAPQAPAADLGQEGYANIALTLAVHGTTMAFEETAVTFKWTDDELAFMTINNAIKFLRLVEPKINRVLFNNTRFLPVDIIRLVDVLNEMDERVLDNDALLQFHRTSNDFDNAYKTLIEKLGLRFSRVRPPTAFHLLIKNRGSRRTPFEWIKMESLGWNPYWLSDFVGGNATELDIHRVANVPNTMEFDPELFRMRPTEIIRKLHMGLSGTETDEKTSQFAERLRWLTPNLEKLTLVHGLGFKFLTWNEVDSVRDEVLQFVNTTAPRLAGHFSGPSPTSCP
ncbi:hypothetical protein M3Y99_01572400 [Aphelenchoides fujianensis]|nr:hypothetical protein M3Y99_01572400 [Aphelenchoides fujianensis]